MLTSRAKFIPNSIHTIQVPASGFKRVTVLDIAAGFQSTHGNDVISSRTIAWAFYDIVGEGARIEQ